MASQKKRNQKTQDDTYSHKDPERLRLQNATTQTKKSAQAARRKKSSPSDTVKPS